MTLGTKRLIFILFLPYIIVHSLLNFHYVLHDVLNQMAKKKKSCGIPKKEWNNMAHQMLKNKAIGIIVSLWGKVGYAINDGQSHAAPWMPLFL
jgi:predicted sugar kinase